MKTTNIRRDVLGMLKTALAAIDNTVTDSRMSRTHKGRVHEATAEARLQVARLEREIERIEIEESQGHAA